MRKLIGIALGAALALQPAAAAAQTKGKAKAAAPAASRGATPPTAAELQQANEVLSLFVSAFNAKEVPDQTKAGLLLCLYANPLGKIARNHAGAIAANKQVDGKSPTQRLLVLAAICNAPLPAGPAAAAPAAPKGR